MSNNLINLQYSYEFSESFERLRCHRLEPNVLYNCIKPSLIAGEGLNSGEHDFEVKFANIELPDAPTTAATLGDQVVLTGRGLSEAKCCEPAVFTIDGSKSHSGKQANL